MRTGSLSYMKESSENKEAFIMGRRALRNGGYYEK